MTDSGTRHFARIPLAPVGDAREARPPAREPALPSVTGASVSPVLVDQWEAPARNVAKMYVAWRSSEPVSVVAHRRAPIGVARRLLDVRKGLASSASQV